MIGVNSILLHRSSNLLRVDLDESAESDAEAEISKLYDVVILIIYTNIINIFGESIFFSTSGFYGGTTCRLGQGAESLFTTYFLGNLRPPEKFAKN